MSIDPKEKFNFIDDDIQHIKDDISKILKIYINHFYLNITSHFGNSKVLKNI
jgi:hypothetical protein